METSETTEPTPISADEARELTIKASALLDDVEDVGLRLMQFVENDETTRPLLPQIKMVASMAFLINSEFVMTCYDRYGVRIDKSRHCDVPVSPPTGYTQALEIADVMVQTLREVEGPYKVLFGYQYDKGTNDSLIHSMHVTEINKRLYTALDYALGVRGAILLILSGFDFSAMNSALGIDKVTGEGTTRFNF
jgi:hypothetical protein